MSRSPKGEEELGHFGVWWVLVCLGWVALVGLGGGFLSLVLLWASPSWGVLPLLVPPSVGYLVLSGVLGSSCTGRVGGCS